MVVNAARTIHDGERMDLLAVSDVMRPARLLRRDAPSTHGAR